MSTTNKNKFFLARPLSSLSVAKNDSIFANVDPLLSEQSEKKSNKKLKGRSYDFVGSKSFRRSYVELDIVRTEKFSLKNAQRASENELKIEKPINNCSRLSKLSLKQVGTQKETRQIHRYKEYNKIWSESIEKISKKVPRSCVDLTLLEKARPHVQAFPNTEKESIINENVVRMWEMSLRNHNKTLLKHLEGNKIEKVHFEQLLQTNLGTSMLEKSIPTLPLKEIEIIPERGMIISGRNKSSSWRNRSERANSVEQPEEVYKVHSLHNTMKLI